VLLPLSTTVVVVLDPPDDEVPAEVVVTLVVALVVVLAPPSLPLSCVDEQAPTDTRQQLIVSAPHAPNRQAFFADMITPPTKFE
jgi:hypothetical protein